MMLNLRRLKRSQQSMQFAQTALVTYLGMALSLASAPVLARELGPDGRGVLAGSFVLVQILSWTAFLGLPRGMALAGRRLDRTSLSGVIVLAILGPTAGIISFSLAGHISNGDTRIETGIKAASILLAIGGLSSFGQEMTLVQGRMTAFNCIRVINVILPSTAVICMSLLGTLSLREAYLISLICQASATALGMIFALPSLRTLGKYSAPWDFSLRYWIGSAFDGIGGRVDQLILTALNPASAVGVYAVAMTCSGAAGGFTQALNQLTYARLIDRSAQASDSKSMLRRRSIFGLGISVFVGAGVVAAVAIAGDKLFGPGFHDLTLTTCILVGAQVLNDQWQLRSFYDSAQENAHALMYASGAAMAVLIGSVVAVHQTWGINEISMACCMVIFAAARLLVRSLLVGRFFIHSAAHPDPGP